jgi:hypothetical protein
MNVREDALLQGFDGETRGKKTTRKSGCRRRLGENVKIDVSKNRLGRGLH